MKTLCLYSNDDGEGQACLILHDHSIDLAERDIGPILPNYNDGGSLHIIRGFVVDLGCDQDQPDIRDQYAEPVPLYTLNLEGTVAQG